MVDDGLSKLQIDKRKLSSRRHTKKRYGILALAVTLVVGVGILFGKGMLTPAVEVQVASVQYIYPAQTFTLLNASGYVVAQREAALKEAEVILDYTNIRAPFDAVVLTKNADVGDIVAPQGAAADAKAAVVTIADMSSLPVPQLFRRVSPSVVYISAVSFDPFKPKDRVTASIFCLESLNPGIRIDPSSCPNRKVLLFYDIW